MLKILHKGLQISLDQDQTGFTGVIATDVQLTVVQKMKAGRIAALTSGGLATLADGVVANGLEPIGFIINDAAGYFFENVPAVASGKIAVTFGPCVVISDQILTSETFAPGDKLYAGTSGNVGLITKTQNGSARLLGIALSSASSAAPELTLAVI